MDNKPEILTAKEVATRLRCCPDTVYELVESGKLRGFCLNGGSFVRKGKRGKKGVRILAASVEQFITAGVEAVSVRVAAAEPAPVLGEQEVVLPPPSADKVKKPFPAGGKSRVVLPPPGRSR